MISNVEKNNINMTQLISDHPRENRPHSTELANEVENILAYLKIGLGQDILNRSVLLIYLC
jgi:hypothetical protein